MRRMCLSAVLLVLGSAALAQTGGSSMVPMPAGEPSPPAFRPIDPPATLQLPSPVPSTSNHAPDTQGRLVIQRSFSIGLEPVPDIVSADRSAGLSGVPMPLSTGAVPALPAIAAPEPPRFDQRYQASPPVPAAPQISMQPLPPAVAPVIIAPLPPAAPEIVPQTRAAPPAVASPAPVQPPAQASAPATPWQERLEGALGRVAKLAPHLPASAIAGMKTFYEQRQFAGVFSDQTGLNARGIAVIGTAGRAADHGLDRQRFARLIELSDSGSADEREMALAALSLVYARDARGARVNPAEVSRLITARPTLPDAAAVLDGLAAAPDPAAALERWNPVHPGYHALRGELLRQTAGSPQIADIIANMERWRWLPPALGEAHVFVNVPGYWLELRRGGQKIFETRVIVGKAQTQTPIFSHQMEYLVVNPYWNVPPSIALKEYLPLLKTNPYALQARGLEVVSRGKLVDPASIDWSRMPRSVAIRQPPGERNALGHIKFMFPNEHAVYLHDTPSRGLFASSRRSFSHGCVRVQNPFGLATAITGWNEKRLRGMIGGPERRLDLPEDVAVHLTYFTIEARDDGTLISREDIYGHHRRMKRLMGL